LSAASGRLVSPAKKERIMATYPGLTQAETDEVDAAIWNADPSVPDSEKFYEPNDGYGDYWNDVEQGRYDDDPSPYDGTYSED
jgi:hypothetical protein